MRLLVVKLLWRLGWRLCGSNTWLGGSGKHCLGCWLVSRMLPHLREDDSEWM